MRYAHSRLAATIALVLLLGPLGNGARADEASKALFKKVLGGTVYVGARGGSGSGWVVDRKLKLVVTNHHVVENEETVLVFFPLYKDGKLVVERKAYRDERGVRGKVLDTDTARDLAVIQLIDALPDGVVELPLASESPDPADRVHSIGNPAASDALWVYSSGTVRQVYSKEWRNQGSSAIVDRKCKVVETQSPINPGDSGGPIVNDNGEVVAVVSSGQTIHNGKRVNLMNWGIEANEVKAFVDQTRTLMNPKTAAEYNLRGERRYFRGRYDDAIADFTQAIRLQKDLAAAYRNRGLALSAKNDFDTAIADCTEAIRLNGDDPSAYLNRGWAYCSKAQFEKALADHTKAIQLDPKNAVAYNNRGLIYYAKGDVARAYADYTRAVEADPRCTVGHSNRGECLYLQGEHDRAIEAATVALRIDPFLKRAYFVRGWSLQAKQQFDKALESFDVALEIYPTDPWAVLYRGNVFLDRGLVASKDGRMKDAYADWDRALAHFARVIELDKKFATAYYQRGFVWENAGLVEKAQDDYREAIRLDSKFANLVKARKKRYLRVANNSAEAIRIYLYYETETKSGKWEWYHDEKSALYYDLQPGGTTYLKDTDDYQIRGRRVRLWARGLKTGNVWNEYKDKDLWLCKDAYLATRETTFTFTFK
jgi:tetratricopeptide (TPR) repeat protein